jgi:hypothetical protein
MKTVVFHTPTIDERGTCIAIYDYAYYNEVYLKNKSIILTSRESIKKARQVNSEVLEKFERRFLIFEYNKIEDIDDICKFCDVLYCIKYGTYDNLVSFKTKTVIHCVFDMSEPHGDVYAGVSSQLCQKYGRQLFVPHMVNFTMDESISKTKFRNALGIPNEAIVFGRHGGKDTFDIIWVKQVIEKVVTLNPNIYFIFINTPRFVFHPNIFFLEKIINEKIKKEFISSCDGMIHGQLLGETFGLSIAEFSVHQKPIICYNGWVLNDNYKKILSDKALYYEDDQQLLDILLTFDKNKYQNREDLNCYKEYTPEKVMDIFNKVFLS